MNWAQLRAILWLRWRLWANQFKRAGAVNAVLAVVVLVMILMGSVGATVGGLIAGGFAGSQAPAQGLLLIWDGIVFAFLLLWLIGVSVEIQRSESIDITKLLHLPVTLPQVFVFNYAVSHATPSLALFLPGMAGFCVGLTFGAGPFLALMLPLVLSFVFMVTAWTYCLRGWLAALMVNKRKRRAVVVWITLVLVLFGQVPNLVFNSRIFRHATHSRQGAAPGVAGPVQNWTAKDGSLAVPEGLLQAHLALPPGWLGYGAMALKERNVWPALGATVASCLIGGLGLMRAYRLTLRFYQGAEGGSGPKPVRQGAQRLRGRLLVERRLPGVPDDTAALAFATLRSLLRAPELKMAAIMPVVMAVIMSSLFFTRSKEPLPEMLTVFIGTAAVVVAAFSLAPTMANVFGLDRNGFRALVLLPTRRHHILLAKNLALFPITATVAVLLLLVAAFLARFSWHVFVTGLLQIPMAFLLFSLFCNVCAILAPYRLAQGTLQAKKPKAIMFLAVLATMGLTPVVMVPVMVPPAVQCLFLWRGWAPWLPVDLIAAAAMLAAIAWLYRCLLPPEGRLLQRRELVILREVTEDVE